MLTPVLVTPPDDLPVSLAEAKLHLGVESNDFDVKIMRLIKSAVAHFDGRGVLGGGIVTQTWRQDYAGFADRLKLPLANVKSVESVTYYDRDNQQQTLDNSVYALFSEAGDFYVTLAPGRDWPDTYSRRDAVSVTFISGDPVPEVPENVKSAILFSVERDYDPINDQRFTQLQRAIDNLVNSVRPVGL